MTGCCCLLNQNVEGLVNWVGTDPGLPKSVRPNPSTSLSSLNSLSLFTEKRG